MIGAKHTSDAHRKIKISMNKGSYGIPRETYQLALALLARFQTTSTPWRKQRDQSFVSVASKTGAA